MRFLCTCVSVYARVRVLVVVAVASQVVAAAIEMDTVAF